MLQQLVSQHAAGGEQGLPEFVRAEWLAARRARFNAAALEVA
jgi:hypothetical protein